MYSIVVKWRLPILGTSWTVSEVTDEELDKIPGGLEDWLDRYRDQWESIQIKVLRDA